MAGAGVYGGGERRSGKAQLATVAVESQQALDLSSPNSFDHGPQGLLDRRLGWREPAPAGQSGNEHHLPGRTGLGRFGAQRLERAELLGRLVHADLGRQGATATGGIAFALLRAGVGLKPGAGEHEQQALWLALGGGAAQQQLEGGVFGQHRESVAEFEQYGFALDQFGAGVSQPVQPAQRTLADRDRDDPAHRGQGRQPGRRAQAWRAAGLQGQHAQGDVEQQAQDLGQQPGCGEWRQPQHPDQQQRRQEQYRVDQMGQGPGRAAADPGGTQQPAQAACEEAADR